MSEDVAKLENKHVEVSGNGYRLTVIKKGRSYTSNEVYIAYLSSTETPFSAEVVFRSSLELQKDLKQWIINMDALNHSEDLVFNRLKEWDGVIEI